MGNVAAVRVELPQEAKKALEYLETRGTAEDRQTLAEEVSHAILATRWRAAQRRATDAARVAGRVPSGDMTEEEIDQFAVDVTTRHRRGV